MTWIETRRRQQEGLSERALRQAELELASGARRDKRVAARAWLPKLSRWIDRLQRRRKGLIEEWNQLYERWFDQPATDAEPVTWQNHRRRAHSYLWGAWIALIGEVGFGAWVAADWATGKWWLGCLVAAAIAVFFTLIFKPLWRAGFDSRHPRAAYNQRETLIWLVAGAILVVGVVFGFVRFFAVAGLVVPVLLAIFTTLLPLFSAGAFVLAAVLEERNVLADSYEHLTAALARLRTIADTAIALDPQPSSPSPIQADESSVLPLTGGEKERAAAAASLGTALMQEPTNSVVGLLFAVVLSAQLLGTVPAKATEIVRLNIWLDASGSLDSRNVEELAEALPVAVRELSKHGLQEVAVFKFAHAIDAVRGPHSVLSVPKQPSTTCRPAEGVAAFFKPVQERHDRECAQAIAESHAPYEAAWQELEVELGNLLRTQPASDPGQTCLRHVLSRVRSSTEQGVTIIITDGAHYACDDGVGMTWTERSPEVQPGLLVVLLVAGTQDGDQVLARMASRARQIREQVPEARIEPAYQVRELLGQGLLSQR